MRRGEPIRDIIMYWAPEMISIAVLICLPPFIDAYLIASLRSTTMYGALGMASNFLHTITKFAEAIPVAAIAVIGRHNGAKNYKQCGKDLGDTFWTTFFIGFLIFLLLFFNAGVIYRWLGVPEDMVKLGVPFLRLRSVGVLFVFLFNAFLGFIKGVKNTRVPMMLNILGMIIFVVFDYALVLGRFGFPQMKLTGSALATIFQFGVMTLAAVVYIITNPAYKKYFSGMFFTLFSFEGALRLINLSWPIMVDKTSLSLAYVWLSKMIASMGKNAIVSFDVIKNLERFAFLPALAFASIITFLVSNYLGADDPQGAKNTIKRVLVMAGGMVFTSALILCFNARYFISIFDPQNEFTSFAAPLLPIITSLIVFDLVQVVLAASLRGAGDVRTVMLGRFIVCFGIFLPTSYVISLLPIVSISTRFVAMYLCFYLCNGLMGYIFYRRLCGQHWKKRQIS